MNLTEIKIKKLEGLRYSYEWNIINFQRDIKFRYGKSRPLEEALNIIGKNKTDYIAYRKKLIKSGVDVSNFPNKLDYMEKWN